MVYLDVKDVDDIHRCALDVIHENVKPEDIKPFDQNYAKDEILGDGIQERRERESPYSNA